MTPQIIISLKGALIGVAVGFVHDLGTWSASKEKFDWQAAFRHYTYGFCYGLMTGMGIAVT